jgi:hypothetical protein
MGERVIFHSFTFSEEQFVQASGENLGRGMPESVVREELDSLDIRV